MAVGMKKAKQKRALEIHPPPADHLLFFMESQTWFEKIRQGTWELNDVTKGNKRLRPDELVTDTKDDQAKGLRKIKKSKIQDELFWFKSDIINIPEENSNMIPNCNIPSPNPKPTPEGLKDKLHEHINMNALKKRISKRVVDCRSLIEIAPEVDEVISLALQNWTRHLLEKLVFQAKKRRDLGKDKVPIRILSDMGSYLQSCRSKAHKIKLRQDTKKVALEKEREVLEAKKAVGELTFEDMARRRIIEKELFQEVEKVKEKEEQNLALQMTGTNLDDFNIDLVSLAKQPLLLKPLGDISKVKEKQPKSIELVGRELNLRDGIALMKSTRCSPSTLYKMMVK